MQAQTPLAEIYQESIQTINQGELNLADYQDHAILFVNTASRCGFTPQYKDLEALYQNYKSKSVLLIGFPCNQFGKQEPGNHEAIQEFCSLNYGVSFPLTQKIDVNGPQAHSIYRRLTSAQPGFLGTQRIKWNFTKFLLTPHAGALFRFAPITPIRKIESQLLKYIK